MKHSTLRIRSRLPHGALNGSKGWTQNLEALEFADDSIMFDLRHNCRDFGLIRFRGHPPREEYDVDPGGTKAADAAWSKCDGGHVSVVTDRTAAMAEE